MVQGGNEMCLRKGNGKRKGFPKKKKKKKDTAPDDQPGFQTFENENTATWVKIV